MGDMLPDPMMFDVLSRLSVETILRCKCVCRQWRHLIADPHFVRLHLSRSREALMIHECQAREFFTCKPGTLEWAEIEHEADPDHYYLDHVKTLELEDCERLDRSQMHQVGSVNGLVCSCRPFDSIYIFNPVLEEYMILPQPRLDSKTSLYGFGVSVTGEYKVIRVCGRNVDTVQFEVCTLGTGQWRVLGQSTYHLNISEKDCIVFLPGVFLNAHVYWIVDAQIYDFDLSTEAFELFPYPPLVGSDLQRLGVLKGRLSLISEISEGLEVWVMKEESWCKEMTIQEDISPNMFERQPLCLVDSLKGTSVLVVHDQLTKELVAYCLNTRKISHLGWRSYFFALMTYRPSFIKLDTFGSERVHKMPQDEEDSEE